MFYSSAHLDYKCCLSTNVRSSCAPGQNADGYLLGRTDCSYVVCGRRLESVVRAAAGSSLTKETAYVPITENNKFVHYTCRTLPHFLALLCQPTGTTLPDETAVVVIDSLSALINHAFPKVPEDRPGPKPGTPFRKGNGALEPRG